MSDLINGRTPENVKRILLEVIYDCDDEIRIDEKCDCPYIDDCNCGAVATVPKELIHDALALIERLESERDYLLNELVGRTCYPCVYCKHLELRVDEEPCNSCLRNPATTFDTIGAQHFEWRGVPKEDNHANV